MCRTSGLKWNFPPRKPHHWRIQKGDLLLLKELVKSVASWNLWPCMMKRWMKRWCFTIGKKVVCQIFKMSRHHSGPNSPYEKMVGPVPPEKKYHVYILNMYAFIMSKKMCGVRYMFTWQPLGPLLKVKLLVGYMQNPTINSKELRNKAIT